MENANLPEVTIRLETSASTPAKIKHGWYRYTLTYKGRSKSAEGELDNTTGNRLVMTALIGALERMNVTSMIRVATDSRYLINGFQLLGLWQQAGFKTARGVPVKNEDLWERIYELKRAHAFSWQEEPAK